MSKVNFLDVYHHDSSTTELSNLLAENYKEAARSALEKSATYLILIKYSNPDMDIPWRYREQNTSNGDGLKEALAE